MRIFLPFRSKILEEKSFYLLLLLFPSSIVVFRSPVDNDTIASVICNICTFRLSSEGCFFFFCVFFFFLRSLLFFLSCHRKHFLKGVFSSSPFPKHASFFTPLILVGSLTFLRSFFLLTSLSFTRKVTVL